MEQRITRMNRVTSKQLYKRRTGWVVATAAAGAILGVSGVGVAHADTVTAKDASSVSSVTKQKNNAQSKAVVLKSSTQHNVVASSAAKRSVQSNTQSNAAVNNAATKSSSVAKTNASSMSRTDAKRAMNDAALNLAQAKQAAQQSAAKLAQVRAQFASQNGVQSGTQSGTTSGTQSATQQGTTYGTNANMTNAGSSVNMTQSGAQGPLARVPSSSVNGTVPLMDENDTTPSGKEAASANYEIIEYVDASGKVIAVKRIEDDVNPAEQAGSNGAIDLTDYPSVSGTAIANNAPTGYEVVKNANGQVVDEAELKSGDLTKSGAAINPYNAGDTDVYLVKPTGTADPATFTEVTPLTYYGNAKTPGNEVASMLNTPAHKSDDLPAPSDGMFPDKGYFVYVYVDAQGHVIKACKVPNVMWAHQGNAAEMDQSAANQGKVAIANCPAGYEPAFDDETGGIGSVYWLSDAGENQVFDKQAKNPNGTYPCTVTILVKKKGTPDPKTYTKVKAPIYTGNGTTPQDQVINHLDWKDAEGDGIVPTDTTAAQPGTSTNTTPAGSTSGNTGSTTPSTQPSGSQSGNTGSTTNTPASKPSDNTGSTTNTPAAKPSGNTGSTTNTPATKPSTDTPAAQPSQPSANQPSADKPSASQPATDQPSAVKPSASQPAQPNQPAATVTPNTKGHATQGTPVAPLANQQISSAVDVVFPPQFKETAVSANAMRRSRVASRMDGQGELANNESQALRRSHKRTLPDTGDAQGVGLIGLGLAALMTAFGLARPARKH